MKDLPTDLPRFDRASATRTRYLVLLWLCLAALVSYICRNAPSVLQETIRTDLELTNTQMGIVLGLSFFVPYALFQLPSGWLGDAWGSRRCLPLFSALWSVLTGLTAAAAGLPLLLLTRLGQGAAQAGIFPCSVLTIGHWFPPGQRAVASGALAAFMSIGGAVAAALTGLLVSIHLHWRLIFILFALPGLAWAAGFWLWFRDRPEEHPDVNDTELALIRATAHGPPASSTLSKRTAWLALFLSPALWCISAQQFFRAAGYIFYASWFPTYLQKVHGVSEAQAGYWTTLPLLGVVLGSLVGGALSDGILVRTGSRRLGRQGLAAASQLASAVLILAARPVGDVAWAVLVLSAGSFCAGLAAPCAYAITIDMGGRYVATVFSIMNMCGNLGAAAFPYVIGRLLDETGDWDLVIFLFAGLYFAATAFWMPLNPNGTILGKRDAPTPPDENITPAR